MSYSTDLYRWSSVRNSIATAAIVEASGDVKAIANILLIYRICLRTNWCHVFVKQCHVRSCLESSKEHSENKVCDITDLPAGPWKSTVKSRVQTHKFQPQITYQAGTLTTPIRERNLTVFRFEMRFAFVFWALERLKHHFKRHPKSMCRLFSAQTDQNSNSKIS